MPGIIYDLNSKYSLDNLIDFVEVLYNKGYTIQPLGKNISENPERVLITGLEMESLKNDLEKILKKEEFQNLLCFAQNPKDVCYPPIIDVFSGSFNIRD